MSASLPSPSSLRDATSPKVRGFGCTGKLPFSKKLPLWGSWREAPERARMLTRSCALGLALPCGSAALSEARSKPRLCVASAVLALSVIASRCHLSQSERPWQSAKFPGLYFTPCCRKKSRQALRSDFTPFQGLPLWGSWREAPERARTLSGPLGPSLAGACGGERASPAAGTRCLCFALRTVRQRG